MSGGGGGGGGGGDRGVAVVFLSLPVVGAWLVGEEENEDVEIEEMQMMQMLYLLL